jgi:hypothetical protein
VAGARAGVFPLAQGLQDAREVPCGPIPASLGETSTAPSARAIEINPQGAAVWMRPSDRPWPDRRNRYGAFDFLREPARQAAISALETAIAGSCANSENIAKVEVRLIGGRA